jgi:hypothetical protein
MYTVDLHVFILDEPTNHLDMGAIEAVANALNVYRDICIYKYVYIYINIYILVCIYIYIIYIYTYIYINVYMYICIYVYINVCMYLIRMLLSSTSPRIIYFYTSPEFFGRCISY